MNRDPQAIDEHLTPWLIIGAEGPTCWRLKDERIALALFSRYEKAEAYRSMSELLNVECVQPPPADVVRIFVACLAADITVGVLDPDQESAKRVFDLRTVLKKVREDLRAGKPLAF